MAGGWYCPKCGSELESKGEFPDTGTTVDFMKMECPEGHEFVLEIERQIGQGTLRQL